MSFAITGLEGRLLFAGGSGSGWASFAAGLAVLGAGAALHPAEINRVANAPEQKAGLPPRCA